LKSYQTNIFQNIAESVIRHQFKCKKILHDYKERILKLWSVISRCQRLILRSSALRYVSWSLLTLILLIW